MKKKTLTSLMIMDAIILVFAGLSDVLLIFAGASSGRFEFLENITLAAQGLVCILAIYYMLTGCKKLESAAYYKWFMLAFAALFPLSMLQSANIDSAGLILFTLCFGALCVLCFGKDLGKNFSLGLAVFVTVCTAFLFVTAYLHGSINDVSGVRIITKLVLAVTAVLMVLAKYQDKKERGSK